MYTSIGLLQQTHHFAAVSDAAQPSLKMQMQQALQEQQLLLLLLQMQ